MSRVHSIMRDIQHRLEFVPSSDAEFQAACAEIHMRRAELQRAFQKYDAVCMRMHRNKMSVLWRANAQNHNEVAGHVVIRPTIPDGAENLKFDWSGHYPVAMDTPYAYKELAMGDNAFDMPTLHKRETVFYGRKGGYEVRAKSRKRARFSEVLERVYEIPARGEDVYT